MNEEGQNYWQGASSADDTVAAPTLPVSEQAVETVTWEASEYIHHEKDFWWFAGMVGVAAILAALSVFLIQSWTFTALIVVMVVAVLVYARRPPRTLSYALSPTSLLIDDKSYSLGEFRAFGVVQDGPLYSIVLIPTKRFMPSVSVYFPQEHGEEIVDLLGRSVPMQKVELDPIDKLVRKLRF